jgi:hypothetical protein
VEGERLQALAGCTEWSMRGPQPLRYLKIQGEEFYRMAKDEELVTYYKQRLGLKQSN